MAIAPGMLKSLVSITQFNRGQASRIFDRLSTESQLIVLKNNQPSAVILSPEEYERLLEIEEDYLLMVEAQTRLANNENVPAKSFEAVMNNMGITEEDLRQAGDVEIE